MDWAKTDNNGGANGNGAVMIGPWWMRLRMWSGTLILGGMMMGTLWLCPEASRAGVAPTVIGGLGALGVALAAKMYGEHKANADAAAKVATSPTIAAPPTAAALVAGAKE